MKEIELTDVQSFITKVARRNYFELVQNRYDFVRFWEEDCRYYLALYTIIGPQDHLTFGTELTSNYLKDYSYD